MILQKRSFLCLPGGIAPAGVREHQKLLLMVWAQTVPERSREQPPTTGPASTRFLPLPLVCQACLQDLCFGLRIYSKSLHHCAQLGTERICCYLATSVGGIWVERPALPPLSPLLWSQSFHGPCPLHVWNSSEPGGCHSPFH